MRGLVVACRYLTVLPLPGAPAQGDLGRAAAWFPVVGLAVGALLAAAALGLDRLVPSSVAAVLAVGLWAGLSGGLHLDGLADTLDGLGGGWTREESLAIMRDARTGAYGVAGIVLVLGLKAVVLASLPALLRWRALIVVPALARLGPLVLARLCGPAREEGAGHAFALTVTRRSLLVAAVVAAILAVAAVGWWGALLFAAVCADAGVWAAYLRRRLGGLTGDCLGALIEGSEAGLLVVLAALAQLALL